VGLIECLLDRRRDPAPVVDAVALLTGPLTHGLGLLTGSTTAAGIRTGLARAAARTAGFDLPGAFHETSDGLVELLDVLTRQVNFVVGSVNGEGERPLRLRIIDVVNELADYFSRRSHARS
jgi:hypothetical protein